MWVTVIWAAVCLIIAGMIIHSVNNRIKEEAPLKQRRQNLYEEEIQVALKERQNDAKFQADTAFERTEHEKARLIKETAEAKATAEIADSPEVIKARIAEEERVIEARAEGRALAAQEQAARQGDALSPTGTIVNAYEKWLEANSEYGPSHTTFERWLGDIDIEDLLQVTQ
jgi:hypothetical protein